MKRNIILVVGGCVLAFITPALFVGAEALSEMTGLSQKFFECGSVVTFWTGLLLLILSKDDTEKNND